MLPPCYPSFCNDCRDLDLCRDDDLARHDWRCRVCAQPYPLPGIERRLVSALQARVRAYALQDLRCVRCKQVAAGHLRRACGLCGGDLAPTMPPAWFRKQLTVFRNVAAYHGFELLQQTAAWLLMDAQGDAQPGAAPVEAAMLE